MAKRASAAKKSAFGIANVAVEVLIDLPLKKVWKLMTARTKDGASVWWPVDFVSSEKTRRFVIEPGLGGKWHEQFGEKNAGVVWFTNVVWDPEEKIAMTGVSLPSCGGGGPTVSNVVWTFAAEGNGKHTRVRLSDESLGKIDAGMRKSLVEGWTAVCIALKHAAEE